MLSAPIHWSKPQSTGQCQSESSVFRPTRHTGQPVQIEGHSNAGVVAPKAPPLWEFSKVPIFPPEGPVQAKLEVGAPNDAFEQEADRIADQVVGSTGVASPPPGAAPIAPQRTSAHGGLGGACSDLSSLSSFSGRGEPLAAPMRAFYENRFQQDFSRVRVHHDEQAAQSARSLEARAYTLGPDIAFGSGQYAPDSEPGARLLAHELTHVVQQGAGSPLGSGPTVSPVGTRIQRDPVKPGSGGDDLNDLLKQLDFDLMDARIAADKRKQQVVATEGEGYWNRFERVSTTKGIYNLQERKFGVRMQQQSPTNQRVLYDVKVVAIEMGHTLAGQPVTGPKTIDLQNKYAGYPRTFDTLAYTQDANGEVLGALPVELKSEGAQTENSLLAKSVKGGINQGDIEANYRPSSTIAKQLGMTSKLTKDAADVEGTLVLKGRDAVTNQEVTIRVKPDRLHQERITSYGRLPDSIQVPLGARGGGDPEGRDKEGKGGGGGDPEDGGGTERKITTATGGDPKPGGGTVSKSATETEPQTPGENIKATVGERLEPVEEHGPSGTGGAVEAGGTIGLQVLGAVFNHFGDKKQAEYAKEALDRQLPGIDEYLQAHPTEGVLLLYKYEQTDPGGDSVVVPGAGFVSVHPAYGRTEDEARRHAPVTIDPSTPGKQSVGDSVWYQPTSSDPANYATPFPPIALARFKPGREYLERVRWQMGKFKELNSEPLKDYLAVKSNPAFQPSFYVLGLPEELKWNEKGIRGHGSTRLNLSSETTANHFRVPSAGGAVPIFAFDEPTDALFEANTDWKTVDDNGELDEHVNFGLLRWAEPEDIEIVRVLSSTDVAPTVPKVEPTEAQIQLESAPAPVRALYETLTARKGGATKSGDIIERFLMTVPWDLTMDEVDRLTNRLHTGASEEDFFASLRKAIENLRADAPSNQTGLPQSGIDFRKAKPGDYTPQSIKEQIQVLLDSVSWAGVDPSQTYFDNVIGKEGHVVNTFAYGFDDQGKHWGALVEVWVGFQAGGLTPVTVRGSSVLVSGQGELLYRNSILLGTTFRLQPTQGAAKH